MKQNDFSNELEKGLKAYTKSSVPEQVDSHIQAGLERGKNQQRRFIIVKHSSLVVLAACIIFVLSVNYSDSFRSIVGGIPGLQKMIEQVEFDRGLQDAVENEYVQIIDKSVTQDGITFTVDHVIADARRLLLFYTIESEQPFGSLDFHSIKLSNLTNSQLDQASRSHGNYTSPEETSHSNLFDFSWKQDVSFDNQLTLSLSIEQTKENTEPKERNFIITFPIDSSRIYESIVHPIEQEYELSGQTIRFNKLTSYPTREILSVQFDEQNDMKFLELSDLHLENEKGEIVSTMSGGKLFSDNRWDIILTGNYFQDYEQLYIVMTKAMALDKDKTEVVVDLEQEKLLKAPDDQLTLLEIKDIGERNESQDLELIFGINDNAENDNGYFIFSGSYYDAAGNNYSSGRQFAYTGGSTIYIHDKDYQNPLTFEVSQYPNYIHGDIRIRIK
ncbi:DUF4179 domain-containing protein [Bacillus solimangrovi]|uniref:DUF4179 domain-containing protein n=1 Tax=Bacillus solimangrovi TaxID=1305675 RepID=A0A1E5LI82_9BACI|nr:DUF4179 domain-containing protein [Bacillus solimangrovi]OEH93775.1 hypothetical protein BFG57_11370 [Bacillus solimangrovi]